MSIRRRVVLATLLLCCAGLGGVSLGCSSSTGLSCKSNGSPCTRDAQCCSGNCAENPYTGAIRCVQ